MRPLRSAGNVLVAAIVALLIGAWLLAPPAARADAFTDGARTYVRAMLDDGIKTLTPRELTDAERRQRLHDFIGRNVDLSGVAKAVLGRYWDPATPVQRQEFTDLFEQYLILSYVNSLQTYTGETFNFLNTADSGHGLAVVQLQILEQGEAPTRLDIDVRQAAGGRYQVVDMAVDGVSIITAKRSEFGAVLRQSGGIDRLNEILRKKNATLGGTN